VTLRKMCGFKHLPVPGLRPDSRFAGGLACGYRMHPNRGRLNAPGFTLVALA